MHVLNCLRNTCLDVVLLSNLPLLFPADGPEVRERGPEVPERDLKPWRSSNFEWMRVGDLHGHHFGLRMRIEREHVCESAGDPLVQGVLVLETVLLYGPFGFDHLFLRHTGLRRKGNSCGIR